VLLILRRPVVVLTVPGDDGCFGYPGTAMSVSSLAGRSGGIERVDQILHTDPPVC
jgi:hypothetical protein